MSSSARSSSVSNSSMAHLPAAEVVPARPQVTGRRATDSGPAASCWEGPGLRGWRRAAVSTSGDSYPWHRIGRHRPPSSLARSKESSMTAHARTERVPHSNAYNIFILVLTVLSLAIMVLLVLPVPEQVH